VFKTGNFSHYQWGEGIRETRVLAVFRTGFYENEQLCVAYDTLELILLRYC